MDVSSMRPNIPSSNASEQRSPPTRLLSNPGDRQVDKASAGHAIRRADRRQKVPTRQILSHTHGRCWHRVIHAKRRQEQSQARRPVAKPSVRFARLWRNTFACVSRHGWIDWRHSGQNER